MDVHDSRYSAPGKIILFGEHAVVYGHPAIVMAIELRANSKTTESMSPGIQLSVPQINSEKIFTFNANSQSFDVENLSSFDFMIKTLFSRTVEKKLFIEIDSKIPVGMGLGSSAAVAVSTIASLSDYLGHNYNLNEINDLAFKAEQITHGNPSGIDNTISTFGGILYFKEKKHEKILGRINMPSVFIVNSGISRNTKDYVEKVAKSRKKDRKNSDRILNSIGVITEEARGCIAKSDYNQLGVLMNQNQKLLEDLGVGHPILTKLIEIAKKNGSLGSKLTGAGGGGCMVSLFENLTDAKKIVEKFNEKGFQALLTNYSDIGVKRE